MIDLDKEEVQPWSKAARTVPGKLARGVSASTLWRWATRGIDGHKLEVLRIGATMYTSQQALQRFFERDISAANVAPTATPAIRRKAVEAAERELAADGI